MRPSTNILTDSESIRTKSSSAWATNSLSSATRTTRAG